MGKVYEDLSLSFPILMGLLVPLLPTMLFLCWLRILGVALGLWRHGGAGHVGSVRVPSSVAYLPCYIFLQSLSIG